MGWLHGEEFSKQRGDGVQRHRHRRVSEAQGMWLGYKLGIEEEWLEMRTKV
jgi:hypothetical protein